MVMRYVTASPDQVELVNFGGFRLVKDMAREAGARAAINFGFFSMSKNHPKDSYPVGLVIDQGQIITWPNDECKHFSGVYSKDGRVTISEVIPPDADWAVTAGPRLLERGQVCERSISDPRWPAGGVSVTASKPRVAIGVRADGKCVLAYWPGATIREMAADMLTLGCVDALAGDGGGSASWYDSEHPEDNVSLRATPNMLAVFGKLDEDKPAGGDKMIVCIDPGHGGPDPGCISPDGIKESGITLSVSKRIAEYLTRAGYKVVLTRTADTDVSPGLSDSEELAARAKIANDAKADLFVSVHCDSVSDTSVEGFEVFSYPGSLRGAALAGSIARDYGIASGLRQHRLDTANFQVLRDTHMPAVLFELCFLSNKGNAALAKEAAVTDKWGLGIAFGICRA